MTRSLLTITLLLVGVVVLAGGAAVLYWITSEDLEAARAESRVAEADAENELRELAAVLLDLSQRTARGLVEGTDRHLKRWLEQEPLTLYRDARDASRVDVAAIQEMLIDEIGLRSVEEVKRLKILTERMARQGDARIEAAAAKFRTASVARSEAAAAARAEKLALRFALLLLGMALLLALTLVVFVINPARRLRLAVNRIAEGDLQTPVRDTRGAQELIELGADVDRMREQLRVATEGLEAEVRRKTEDLARTLDERTAALDDLRATQDRLVQAAKMAGLGTLAGGVAHEFNNLIGGILGCLESARSSSADEHVLEDLDMAQKTAGRAAVLVRALLDVARPGERAFAPVDLAAMVADAVRTAAPTANSRGVTVDVVSRHAPAVLGDEGQLHQVALNLVTNAIQATPKGGAITVETRGDGAHGVIEVRDAGSGVPAADRDRIFDPFFSEREGGTGLGLFVSYGIVERHGGHIDVGDAPEGGARFTVRIPAQASPPGSANGPGVASSPA